MCITFPYTKIQPNTRAVTLPPEPSLDRGHFRTESASTSLGRLEALSPAAHPYICKNKDAPTLMLIPGLGLDGLAFVRQLPLGAMTHLQYFQTPNQPAAGEAGLEQFARCVEEYILAKKLDQRPGGLILGGNSMGGAIALTVAIRRRVKLRGLVLIGTSGSCENLPLLTRLAAPLAWIVPMNFFRGQAWRLAGKFRLRDLTADEGQWMSAPGIQRTHGYFGRAVGALTHMELIDKARELDIPALIIHGEYDPVLKLKCAAQLAQALRNSTFVTIPRAGHSIFFTCHQHVNMAVAAFISSVVRPRVIINESFSTRNETLTMHGRSA